MIDARTSWTQATTALATENFELAFQIMESAWQEADRTQRARLGLYLASLHSLYGESGTPEMARQLERAVNADPAIAQDPLFLALQAERLARDEIQVQERTLQLAQAEPLARFHAVSALALAGQTQQALDVEVTPQELPPHLGWRLRSWQADSEEALGHTQEALHLYAEAARLSSGENRASMLQEQAALHLQLGEGQEAEEVLRRARHEYRAAGDDAAGLAGWFYLLAQTELSLDRLSEALISVQEADRLERQVGDSSYGVALVWGQILAAQGQPEQALPHFEAALGRAGPEDRPYALHELGVALLDLDRTVDARERLESILNVPDYPFLPEVLADVAEADYRLGRLQEAQTSAEQALAQGAVVPASLVLGSIELDYYHLDEALHHYARVLREAAPGTRDWVTAQQLSADIMAQQGFPDPAAAYAAASQALEHTDPADDWHATLTEHLHRAEALMGAARNRTLN